MGVLHRVAWPWGMSPRPDHSAGGRSTQDESSKQHLCEGVNGLCKDIPPDICVEEGGTSQGAGSDCATKFCRPCRCGTGVSPVIPPPRRRCHIRRVLTLPNDGPSQHQNAV